MESNLSLQVSVVSDDYTEQELYKLSTDLLSHIYKSGLMVVRYEGEKSTAPSKGIPIDINTLLITLASAGAFNILVQAIKDWALRAEGRRVKIKLDVKNKALELDYSPTSASEKEISEFVRKLSKIMREG